MPKKILLIALLLLFLFSAANASTYYVDKDSLGGKCDNSFSQAENSEAKPWCSPTIATNNAQAGDTVFVRAGTYFEQLSPQRDGTESAYIEFKPYQGEQVIIDGKNVNSYLIYLGGRKYIRLNGFALENAAHYCVLVESSSQYIELLENTLENCGGTGVYLKESSNILLKGNSISKAYNGIELYYSKKSVFEDNIVHGNRLHGIYLYYSNFNNFVHNTIYNQFSSEASAATIRRSSNNSFERNLFYNNFSPSSFIYSGFIAEYSNLTTFSSNALSGFSGYGVYLDNSQDAKITNNSSYSAGNAAFAFNGTYSGTVFENNACSTETVCLYLNSLPESGFASGHNALFSSAGTAVKIGEQTYTVEGFQSSTAFEKNSISLDPQYANPSGLDFAPLAESPLIDNGSSTVFSSLDLLGSQRLVGKSVDIGAVEFQGTECVSGSAQDCTTADNCVGTRSCSQGSWGSCIKSDPTCPSGQIADSDADSVPAERDCNDEDSAVKECTGCAVCSNKQCVAGTCAETSCTASSCFGSTYISFPESIPNSCLLSGSAGICTSNQCSSVQFPEDERCKQEPVNAALFLAIVLVALAAAFFLLKAKPKKPKALAVQ